MATPLRLGGPDRAPGGTRRTGYTTRGTQGWAPRPAYSGPVYGSWTGVRAKPPKIKNAGQRALLFIRNTNGKPGGRWVARKPATPVAAPKPPPAPAVAPAAGTDGGYTGPYAEYPEWARRVLQGVDTDFANHSKYVGFDPTTGNPTGGGVASWLSSALNGVNQMAGGMLGEYGSNMGHVAGAVDQAAGALPAQVASPLAGGVVSSPRAYDYLGRSQGMSGEADSIRGQAAAQVTQARSNLGLASQGYINSLADYAKGLPAVYAERRRAAREEIDKFLVTAAQDQADFELDQAKFEETQRSNRADEAVRVLNARNGLITALVNAGVKIDQNTLRAIDMAADNNRADREAARPTGVDPSQPAPTGYVYVKQADGSYKLVKDPTYSRPSASGGGAQGRTAQWYRQRGYSRPGGNVQPGKLNTQVWDVGRDNSGQVWVKRRSNAAANGGGGGSTTQPQRARDLWPDLQASITEVSNSSSTPPSGERRQQYIAQRVVAWIVNKNRDFTKPDGTVDKAKILAVINNAMGEGPTRTLVGRLLDSHIVRKPNGKLVWVN